MDNKSLGQIAYEACVEFMMGNDFNSFFADSVWNDMPPEPRQAWEAAAQAVRSYVLSDLTMESDRLNGGAVVRR